MRVRQFFLANVTYALTTSYCRLCCDTSLPVLEGVFVILLDQANPTSIEKNITSPSER